MSGCGCAMRCVIHTVCWSIFACICTKRTNGRRTEPDRSTQQIEVTLIATASSSSSSNGNGSSSRRSSKQRKKHTHTHDSMAISSHTNVRGKKTTSNSQFDLVFWLCPFGVVVFTHKTRTDFLCAVCRRLYIYDFIHRRVSFYSFFFSRLSCLSFFLRRLVSSFVRIARVRHYVTCGLTVLIGRAADWYWKYFEIILYIYFFLLLSGYFCVLFSFDGNQKLYIICRSVCVCANLSCKQMCIIWREWFTSSHNFIWFLRVCVIWHKRIIYRQSHVERFIFHRLIFVAYVRRSSMF